MLDVFIFTNYRLYLRHLMPTKGRDRGLRSKLAEALGCKLSYLSMVLAKEKVNLSLEHAMAICDFFKLSEEESNYFVLLISRERAGSKLLEKYFDDQIETILKNREEIKSRIKFKNTLSKEDQAIYYSEWYYTALHMILRNCKNTDLKNISEILKVPANKLQKAMTFFEDTGILKKKEKGYEIQDIRIHIDENSSWLNLHHRNWRQKTIQLLDTKKAQDLNYTLITSISEEVAEKIKLLLLNSIQKSEPLIKEAPDQVVYNLNIDFQKVF